MDILLQNGANINAVNKGGCSTLHVAVNKQHLDCVKVLLDHNCDVNIQDTYGDTAQHDAIGMSKTYLYGISLRRVAMTHHYVVSLGSRCPRRITIQT